MGQQKRDQINGENTDYLNGVTKKGPVEWGNTDGVRKRDQLNGVINGVAKNRPDEWSNKKGTS